MCIDFDRRIDIFFQVDKREIGFWWLAWEVGCMNLIWPQEEPRKPVRNISLFHSREGIGRAVFFSDFGYGWFVFRCSGEAIPSRAMASIGGGSTRYSESAVGERVHFLLEKWYDTVQCNQQDPPRSRSQGTLSSNFLRFQIVKFHQSFDLGFFFIS